MSQLIKFEFRKLFRSTSFLVFAIIAGVLLLINAFFLYDTYEVALESGVTGEEFNEVLSFLGISTFDLVYSFADNSFIYLLAGIFISLFVCADYATLTIKNIYSKGYSRRKVYFAKYIVSLIGILSIVGVVYILSILSSLLIFGKIGPIPRNYFVVFLLQILVIIVYHAFFFFIANSLGKSGAAVSICIIIPTAVNLLTSLFDMSMEIENGISNYWISNLSSVVARMNVSGGDLGFVAIVSIGHILVWLGLGYLLNRKKSF